MSESESWLMKNSDLAVLCLMLLENVIVVFIVFVSNTLAFDIIPNFIFSFTIRAVLWILIVPLALHLPNGKKPYREYFRSIKLIPIMPLGKKLLYGIVGSILTLAGLFLAALLYGNWILDLSQILPPTSWVLLTSFQPGIWEEVGYRGVILTLLLKKHTERKAIVLNSILFSLTHLTNLLVGQPPIVMLGQLIFVFTGTLFLGLLFVKTKSLIPCMITHYAGDAFGPLFLYTLLQPGPNLIVGGILMLVGWAVGNAMAILFLFWTEKRWLQTEDMGQ
jgi:membrane protease YdiL (CAAX protease family)